MRPTLQRICALIGDYVLWGAPRGAKAPLSVLLDRCARLGRRAGLISEKGEGFSKGEGLHPEGSKRSSDLEHSLLLTELRSLLWRYVSNMAG